MDLASIINTVKNISFFSILDILVVSYIFYKGYMLIKETRAEQLLKGILLILVLIPISYFLRLTMVYTILSKTITIGVLSIIIIFQPEIRRALEHLGRTAFNERHILLEDETLMEEIITELVNAVENLSESKTGALIAIEQTTGLNDVIANGTKIDGIVTAALLENIFVVNTPLHDGATVIRNTRIVASGCVLPLTGNTDINKKLGTRHRAAIGLSEVSDALIVVVSEETGTISLAINGRLTRNYDKDKLKDILIKIMKTRQVKASTLGERVKTWIKIKFKKTS
ncbi:diadenylate cyclase CdaA [Clostridium algidicarnis]|uniref:Diadenylate cyclase n=2 Tax=Clostridium algidicarnis TaxID=37659 RepID=A0A2S6FYF4_9CLOT|nr:diadenylate cyclase CdaA [Clostridium algidicarnis]MBB6631820.1 TIGR00159 family protein [Clostridium algidicarnis]MBB6698132.1 TIGR00159 family protein [Clostridium algidicarnis]MBU3192514.1 diadenylate cyclase CdaA [Clostridium algidicarnis]MBU3204303.1 diadenylate cyclase CdaA [Clostridium algidicarnis]MBU3207009.1 diadenylate cyclase CdaA [Clostridium algidicarnis]